MRRLSIAALLLAAACTGLPPAPAPTNPIRFLLINDVYVPDTLADGTGGLARVAALRARVAAEGPTIFVLAGDVLSPSLLSKYYSGLQMVEPLNAAKLDYATFGNHEFELARDTLVARIAGSRFKWLSSNCTEANGQPFPGVRSWDTLTVQGHKLGLFGLTLQGDYRKYVRCVPPDSAAHRVIDSLATMGAELIVAITHQSLAADQTLLEREPRLDLVLGGHEHEHHELAVGDRHVLKADANSRTAQFATIWGGKGDWRQATTLVPITASTVPRPDTTVQRIVRGWDDSLRRRLGPERTVGTAEVDIDARDAIQRRAETLLGALITDGMRTGTQADVALINAGTLRLDDVIRAGPITNWTLESIFLFPDETRVVTFPLTGARLRQVLEHGVSDGRLGAGGFLQVAGVAFSYDPARPSGSRIVGDLRRPGGGTIRAGDTLRVAFPVYPACEGGDGYQIPEAATACAGWQQAPQQAPRAVDLLIQYVQGPLGGRVAGEADQRIVAEQQAAK